MPDDSPQPSITELIHQAAQDSPDARDALYARVYDDLRDMARIILRHRGPGDLQPTALVHEVVLKLERANALETMRSRKVFFSVALRAMNQILTDHYRRRKKNIDSPDRQAHPLDEVVQLVEQQLGFDFERLQQGLERLAADSPRQHSVVLHRFFGGLSTRQTAELLEVSEPTVHRDWRLARAKLMRFLLWGEREDKSQGL